MNVRGFDNERESKNKLQPKGPLILFKQAIKDHYCVMKQKRNTALLNM